MKKICSAVIVAAGKGKRMKSAVDKQFIELKGRSIVERTVEKFEKCDAVDVGEIGIFVVNGDAYIKELGDQCLISQNEKYKPIRIGESDSVYCCGRVIGVVGE